MRQRPGSTGTRAGLRSALALGVIALLALVAAARSRIALIRAETARVTAEEDSKRLLQVIDNSSAVIYMRDSDGRYLLVNRRYEELFGVNRREIVGMTDFDLFPPEVPRHSGRT